MGRVLNVGRLLGEMPRGFVERADCILNPGCKVCGWDLRIIKRAVGSDWRSLAAWVVADRLLLIDQIPGWILIAPRYTLACTHYGTIGQTPPPFHSELLIHSDGDTWATSKEYPLRPHALKETTA